MSQQLDLFPKSQIAPKERARVYIKALLALLKQGRKQ